MSGKVDDDDDVWLGEAAYDGNVVGISSEGFESIDKVFASATVTENSKTVWFIEAAALHSSTWSNPHGDSYVHCKIIGN